MSNLLRALVRPPPFWVSLLPTALLLVMGCGVLAHDARGLEITRCEVAPCLVKHQPEDVVAASITAHHLDAAVRQATEIMGAPPSSRDVVLVLAIDLQENVAEFRGWTGPHARRLDWTGANRLAIRASAPLTLSADELRRVMLHEVAHYWWRIGDTGHNWLNEWGAIGMEVIAGMHPVVGAPPQCRANWSPSLDPQLNQEAGQCVRDLGRHAMQKTLAEYRVAMGKESGDAALRAQYRDFYRQARANPALTPAAVGHHFARPISDPATALVVEQAFARLRRPEQ